MSGKQKWGRKETILWPPHAPIYTLSALAVGLLVTMLFVWQHLRFSETPLQQTYTTTYVETMVGAMFKQSGTYRLLYVGGGKAAPRLALPADFLPWGNGSVQRQEGSSRTLRHCAAPRAPHLLSGTGKDL